MTNGKLFYSKTSTGRGHLRKRHTWTFCTGVTRQKMTVRQSWHSLRNVSRLAVSKATRREWPSITTPISECREPPEWDKASLTLSSKWRRASSSMFLSIWPTNLPNTSGSRKRCMESASRLQDKEMVTAVSILSPVSTCPLNISVLHLWIWSYVQS